jgi:hypothetical protein
MPLDFAVLSALLAFMIGRHLLWKAAPTMLQ